MTFSDGGSQAQVLRSPCRVWGPPDRPANNRTSAHRSMLLIGDAQVTPLFGGVGAVVTRQVIELADDLLVFVISLGVFALESIGRARP